MRSSQDETLSFDEEKFTQMQRDCSETIGSATLATEQEDFVQHQQKVFDEMSGFFGSNDATPPEIVPIVRYLANRIVQQMTSSQEQKKTFQLLDAGCGAGVLFPYLLEAANKMEIQLHITGLDLSPKMVKEAKIRATQALEQHQNTGHEVTVVNSEFVTCVLGQDYVRGGEDENHNVEPCYRAKFDGVVTNACFGNFFNTESLMTALARCLTLDGVMFVTHPLGAAFVQKLHKEDPSTVPRCLPNRDEFEELTLAQPLKVLDFVQQVDLVVDKDKETDTKTVDVYFASATGTNEP